MTERCVPPTGDCARLIALTRPVAELPRVAVLLGSPVVLHRRAGKTLPGDGVIGWGLKPSSDKARSFAERHDLPFYHIEDGFLRSVDLGQSAPPLSLVIDNQGIYYDANTPSRLEQLIAAPHCHDEMARARKLIETWKHSRVSKYNHARDYLDKLPERFVLAIDQTFGDSSIHHGMATPATFRRMLSAALDENPDCTVILKVHPEAISGRKKGHFDLPSLAKESRLKILAEDAHPASLLDKAKSVYAVTSQLGFEGLLWGKPVKTFGMPFYAGWGLTVDALPAPPRRRSVQLEDLVHAALIDYPSYTDPETGENCSVEQLITWMALQRKMRERFPPKIYAHGFSSMKRPIVRKFFQGSQVTFVKRLDRVPPESTIAVWGVPARKDFPTKSSLVQLEDGFLRSVGLGADLFKPLSWAMDRQGIYYDASSPSEIETLLQSVQFDQELLTRAVRLRQIICEYGLTKYNVGKRSLWDRPQSAEKVILVPGQVESDASIRLGTVKIRSNLNLLKAVRRDNPEAYLLYKPHPDVVAGLRAKGSGEASCCNYCDEVIVDFSMDTLFDTVDEVHIMTSLAGFEGLLRGKRVVCYGKPFYSGWGLTVDKEELPRRTRKLTLDQLVAGVLISYPTYISRRTGYFTTPEGALRELLDWRKTPPKLALWQKLWRLKMRIRRKP